MSWVTQLDASQKRKTLAKLLTEKEMAQSISAVIASIHRASKPVQVRRNQRNQIRDGLLMAVAFSSQFAVRDDQLKKSGWDISVSKTAGRAVTRQAVERETRSGKGKLGQGLLPTLRYRFHAASTSLICATCWMQNRAFVPHTKPLSRCSAQRQ